MTSPRIEHLAEGITVYCADCREVLPMLGRVDAVVTDPPYGINGGFAHDVRRQTIYEKSGLWDDTEEYILTHVIPCVQSALQIASRAAITPGNRCGFLYPRPSEIGCFWKPGTPGQGRWGFNTFDVILYYGRDPRHGKGPYPNGRICSGNTEANGHPCPRPYIAWEWLVRKASVEDETILDPFMGSGTTGVACVRLGRKFIGIEIEPRYFDIACRRISEALRQGDMFVEKPKPAKQEALGL